MSSTSNVFTNIYLAKENGELVLHEGINPNQSTHADERVLVVGGGVTGLTVSLMRSYRARNIIFNELL